VRRFPLAGRAVRADGDLARRFVRVGPYYLYYVLKEETLHLVLLQHVRRANDAPDLTLLR
jgi:plasmid stabilization system protein ParE